MIGVSYGAASEFHYQGKINEDPLPWNPSMVSNALEQDDLYVGISYAELLDQQGLDASTVHFGEAYRQTRFGVCHGNAGARRLLDSGFSAPLSSDPRFNIHVNDIDFQIGSDFIGMMAPGLPLEALDYATRVGRVVGYGEGLYGGVFVGAMYSAAFFQSNPRRIVETALLSLPEQSEYAQILRDVLMWSKEHPNDWRQTWHMIETKWHRSGSCPDEADSAFDIQATLNGAYVAMGLLYGNGDFAKTLEIATRAGQDSDCNPSTAGGIIGVVLGYKAIPEIWKSGIPELADKPFFYTNSNYNEIVASTLRRAISLVQRAGGRVDNYKLFVPQEQPRPALWESWSMGRPAASLRVGNGLAWKLTGNWVVGKGSPGLFCGPRFDFRTSGQPGDTATVKFEGTSVAIVGIRSESGGRADLFLDGNRMDLIDFYIRKGTVDTDLWHSNALHAGSHTIELRVRSDHNPESVGTTASIGEAIIFEGPTVE